MIEQEKPNNQTEQKIPVVPEGILRHQTHFTVPENPWRGNEYDSGYEWVDCGHGRWKRVPKKTLINR